MTKDELANAVEYFSDVNHAELNAVLSLSAYYTEDYIGGMMYQFVYLYLIEEANYVQTEVKRDVIDLLLLLKGITYDRS